MRRIHDLDAKDRQILALLEADGRRSNSDIARLTGLVGADGRRAHCALEGHRRH